MPGAILRSAQDDSLFGYPSGSSKSSNLSHCG